MERAKSGKAIRGEGKRAEKWNKRIEDLAHINKIASGGLLNARKEWRANLEQAKNVTRNAEVPHMLEDRGLNTAFANDNASGAAGDVNMNNVEGLQSQLLKQGVGALRKSDGKGGLELDLRDDGTGALVPVIDGVNGQARLDAATARITDFIKNGDKVGAYRQALMENGTFYSGKRLNADGSISYDAVTHQQSDEIDKNVAAFSAARRTYGDEVLSQYMVKKASAGGTYYNTAVDTWLAADRSTGHDGMAQAEMAASLRGVLINAGRIGEGGGSHGTTLKFMNDIAAATKDIKDTKGLTTPEGQMAHQQAQAKLADLQYEFSNHVIENNPMSSLMHPGNKENYLGNNIMGVFAQKAKRAARAAKGKPNDSPEHREYMRAVASFDNAYQQTLASKPGLIKKLGDNLVDAVLDDVFEKQVQVPVLGDDGQQLIENGQPVFSIEVQYTPLTLRAATAKYRDDINYQNFHREFYMAEEKAANRLMQQLPLDATPEQIEALRRQQMQAPPDPNAGVGMPPIVPPR